MAQLAEVSVLEPSFAFRRRRVVQREGEGLPVPLHRIREVADGRRHHHPPLGIQHEELGVGSGTQLVDERGDILQHHVQGHHAMQCAGAIAHGHDIAEARRPGKAADEEVGFGPSTVLGAEGLLVPRTLAEIPRLARHGRIAPHLVGRVAEHATRHPRIPFSMDAPARPAAGQAAHAEGPPVGAHQVHARDHGPLFQQGEEGLEGGVLLRGVQAPGPPTILRCHGRRARTRPGAAPG